jgi:S1-C subfamily serine protease
MRIVRPFFFGLLLAAGFYFYTTHHHNSTAIPDWVAKPNKVELTEAASPPTFDTEEQINIDVYKKGIPSVVNITSTAVSMDFFWGPIPQQGQGSGFIIDKEGHILTNYHVIEGARQVKVTLHNKKTYPAEIIGSDRLHDLAVIQIKTPGVVVPATLGDSKNLVVGQKVYAIGNPFGLSGTMTRGIISSLRPIRNPEGAFIDEAIQTDAAINPGNSGGPLLNSRGEVIGINSMIATGGSNQSAGIGFAIPINTAKAAINDLVTYGRVRRPTLGIIPLAIGPELAEEMGLPADNGILIMKVQPGGAADRAGLRAGSERAFVGNRPIVIGGDLIVAIDGEPVSDQTDLANVMDKHHTGDTVTVTIFRGKRKMDVKVVLQEEGRQQV